ncbi:MAG TPA: hypothetical protein VGV38_15200 [Pyrinomonadaceae bacterium]|nr:hypothetical protein [Pyrinomonadaceae bacterium]
MPRGRQKNALGRLTRGLAYALALLACGCAAMSRQPETGQPAAGPPYPVVLAASEDRRARVLAAWTTFATEQGATRPPVPELQPVTASVRALPESLSVPLRLPRVGGADGAQQTEEELRESLRRFINTAAPLLGASPDDLTLIERADEAGGTRRAAYEQRPFPYSLRGGFGRVEIRFTPDLRVTSLSSTALPDAERLRTALVAVRPALTAADAAQRLVGRTVTVRDAAGTERTVSVNNATEATTRELVVLPVASADNTSSLALHLAWEVAIGGAGANTLVYVDALSGDTLAAVPAPAAAPAR